MTCLFCRIAQGEIKSELLYEDSNIVAFNDINPQAPTHILIIPKQHIATINDLSAADLPLIGEMVQVAKRLATQLSLADDGYRLVFNVNQHGGQMVYHIHLHFLGGRYMQWPPG